ncbi:hyaluronidase-2-like isoform X2 [Phyllopteryx taeniolatus]|uniref:hyaluronidase-2-like isoform X2 n=1 Tax=Phyllopteryx taeniolatus TaxID=161469 RepID=UPI002AD4201C|nr:hyaluronidase-2-like isoform X2 [Phyllopteryx taeniolatus]
MMMMGRDSVAVTLRESNCICFTWTVTNFLERLTPQLLDGLCCRIILSQCNRILEQNHSNTPRMGAAAARVFNPLGGHLIPLCIWTFHSFLTYKRNSSDVRFLFFFALRRRRKKKRRLDLSLGTFGGHACPHRRERAESDSQFCPFPSGDMHWTVADCKALLLLIVLLWDGTGAFGLKATGWPLYSQKPLLLAWNAPTEDCFPRHRVSLQLDQFQIVASPNEGFVKQNLTIFYNDRLGLYPHFEPDGTPVNGGLPQVASLAHHLDKMPEGVKKYIREPSAKGLAVIDWEEWRPLWIRNWEAKDIYRRHSRELVRQKNPTWPPERVSKVALQEFEMSAKKFMLETLKLAKHLRPNQLWGFYLFPDCYNHDYRRTLESYTGRCPDVEVARNEQLNWLWTESTALFPSIYMGKVLRSSASGRQFVRNRVKEGMRLASSGDGLARPVFVYTRPTYMNSLEQLTETDLVSTIGESVALGAAGIILWGDAAYASNKTTCSELDAYLRGPLGKYLLNVSTAAEVCSQALCSSHGRCLRQDPDAEVYLHLNPDTHSVRAGLGGKLEVVGEPGQADRAGFGAGFLCQCYSGFEGERCEKMDPLYQKGAAYTISALTLQRVILLLFYVGVQHIL